MNRKHNILIVDDDPDDREIICDAFKKSVGEQQYVCLENGEMLLRFLEENRETIIPSLILLDLNMPGKNGFETLKELKSDDRFQVIPTIVFTTSSSQNDRNQMYGLGANCFITKPDSFNKLLELAGSISKLWLQ